MNQILYKHSINFNIVTTDIDHDRLKEKPVRIKAMLRFNNLPALTFSGVDRIILGKYKLKETKIIKGNEVKIKIVPVSDAWDFEKQFPKNNVSNAKISRNLTSIQNKISDLFTAHCNELGRFPEVSEIKDVQVKINSILKNKPLALPRAAEKVKTSNLLEYIFNYIIGARSTPPNRLMNGKPYKARSIQSFLNTLNILIAYKEGEILTFKSMGEINAIKNLPVITFEEIDMKFYESFRDYLGLKGLGVSYFGSQIKYLKKFLNESMIEGFHSSVSWKDKRFVKQTAAADNEALSIDQLKNLGNYDLSSNPSWDNARDLFLVGCWTGLRYSDYSRLTNNNIDGNFIDIHTKKTSEQVTIPILKELRRILNKYTDSATGFPRVISDVKLNTYIKDICKEVGENADKSFLQIKNVKIAKITGVTTADLPLYQLISTHTGRRSFATNAIRLQIPKSAIMKITGHKTETAFDAYVKIKSRESASILADHFNSVDL